MRVFGIGFGLFLLSFLWTLAILVILLTGRAKTPYAFLGPMTLLVTILITVIFLVIPRASPQDRDEDSRESGRRPVSSELPTDWMYFWRTLIILINLIASIIGLIVIYINWIVKSMTRLKAPSTEFLQLNDDKAKNKLKGKKNKKIKKEDENKEATAKSKKRKKTKNDELISSSGSQIELVE